MFARRQLEQGDNLSQRTLRFLQTMQLRSFVVEADGVADELLLADSGDLALFSEGQVEAPALVDCITSETVTGGTCDMMKDRTVDSVLRVLPER